jgi:hypothetical protein
MLKLGAKSQEDNSIIPLPADNRDFAGHYYEKHLD